MEAAGLSAAHDEKPLTRPPSSAAAHVCGSSRAATAAAAEAGRRQGGGSSTHGSGKDGASEDEAGEGAAPTYAQRLAAAGGDDVQHARGVLAAALCKARQDILLSVFVTRPAIWSPFFNLAQASLSLCQPLCACLVGGGGQGCRCPPAAAAGPSRCAAAATYAEPLHRSSACATAACGRPMLARFPCTLTLFDTLTLSPTLVLDH
jgi:hypothetical protein